MSRIKDVVFYIPVGVNPSKMTCIKIGVWMVISIVFFCFVLTRITGGAREMYFFYFGGIIPMMIAFQDKLFVEEKIKKEFKTLLLALYRQNFIFLIMFIIVSCFDVKSFESTFVNLSVVALYWITSIPLSVIYDNRKWCVYTVTVLLVNCLFLFCLRQFTLNYILPTLFIIIVLMITVSVAKKQIDKHFG